MDQRSVAFLTEAFREYYRRAEIHLPPRFTSREFAFTFFGGSGMVRHMGFKRRRDVSSFVLKRTPRDFYHSTAYYRNPEAPTMDEKGWLGADLIFDLDADHLSGVENMSWEEMMSLVKRQTKRLLDEFILGDLGFDARDVLLVYSGRRGYHIHVRSPQVLTMDSNQRREIVEYVEGGDLRAEGWKIFLRDYRERLRAEGRLEVDQFIFAGSKGRRSGRQEVGEKFFIPSVDEPGWYGRIGRGIRDLAVEMERVFNESGHDGLWSFFRDTFPDLPWQWRKRIIKGLLQEKSGVTLLSRLADLSEPVDINSLGPPNVVEAFLRAAVRMASVGLGTETDEPVTTDTKRLIRMPGSLHGKTGLVVKPIPLDELSSFDPFRDAVWEGFEGEAEVRLTGSVDVKLGGSAVRGAPGDEVEVPLCAAIFLVALGLAVKI